jgi:hypothetical protein
MFSNDDIAITHSTLRARFIGADRLSLPARRRPNLVTRFKFIIIE